MDFSLQEKIEKMRREPEHIRMRYVAVSVFCSMILILGIWFLSVQDSVTTATQDASATLEKGKGLTGGAPSLDNLFQQSAPLRVDDRNTKGGDFFEQQRMGGQGAEAVPPVPAQ